MFIFANNIHQTAWMVFFNILIVFCNYCVLKDTLKYPFKVSKAKYNIGWMLCLLFCLFSFWGTDWFHYLETYDIIRAGYETNLENVYVWIIQNISPYFPALVPSFFPPSRVAIVESAIWSSFFTCPPPSLPLCT